MPGVDATITTDDTRSTYKRNVNYSSLRELHPAIPANAVGLGTLQGACGCLAHVAPMLLPIAFCALGSLAVALHYANSGIRALYHDMLTDVYSSGSGSFDPPGSVDL